jgi:hypothetical protein
LHITTSKEENVQLRKEVERLQSSSGTEQARIRDDAQLMARVGTSTSSRGRGGASSSGQRVNKSSQTSGRDHSLSASTRTNSSEVSHGTQFHGPTSVMFDGEHPPERRKVGSIAVASVSQKTQLLGETARQRMLQIPFPQSSPCFYAAVN